MTQPQPSRLGFEVEPAALRGAAGSFASEADQVAELAQKLDRFLVDLGPCWGDDEVGQRFATSYVPAAEATMSNLLSLSTAMHHIGSALRAIGDNYERVDQSMFTLKESLTKT
jgi:uncharacterized protein YukE